MPWYVIYTQARNEKKVAERLEKIGVEVYCPLVRQIKQWSDRKKEVQVPLINSYVFVKLADKERQSVFEVSGVVRYLFWLGKPAVVRDEEIQALRESLTETLTNVEITTYKEGDTLSIPIGPFKGREGTIEQVNKKSIRLVLKELGIVITLTTETKA